MHWLVGKFLGIRKENDYPNLSLIVLSRHNTRLDDSICITLDPDHRGQVSADVAKFVKSKVEELSQKLGFDLVFEENATRMLLEKSEGTFLWVGFVRAFEEEDEEPGSNGYVWPTERVAGSLRSHAKRHRARAS
jgi:hypothetical protein